MHTYEMSCKSIRVLLSILIGAVVVSCSNDGIESNLANNGIAFNVKDVASSATRGAAATVSTIVTNGNKFGMYCYKDNSGADFSNPYFALNTPITYNGTRWEAPLLYIWLPNTLHFFAYYPYIDGSTSTNGLTINNNSGTTPASPTISYTAPTTVANQPDLLAYRASISTKPTDNYVNVQFEHVLSAIKFAVGSDCKQSIIIKEISLSNILQKGTYTMSTGAWSTPTTQQTYSLTGLSKTVAATDITNKSVISDQALFVVPQSLGSSNVLSVTYEDGSTTYTKSVSLASLTMAKGKLYTFYLDIKDELIVKSGYTEVDMNSSLNDNSKDGYTGGNTPDVATGGKPGYDNSSTIPDYFNGGITKSDYERGIIHEYVDLGLSVKWATMNIGATTVAGSSTTALGDYFAWGARETWYSTITWSGSTPSFTWKNGYDDGYTSNHTPSVAGSTLSMYEDTANALWGGSWRMPTIDEIKELSDACNGSALATTASSSITSGGVYFVRQGSTINGTYYGVNGLLFVLTADPNKRVFFPYTWLIYGKELQLLTDNNLKVQAGYRSSSIDPNDSDRALDMTFLSSADYSKNQIVTRSNGTRYGGFSIRPVCP